MSITSEESREVVGTAVQAGVNRASAESVMVDEGPRMITPSDGSAKGVHDCTAVSIATRAGHAPARRALWDSQLRRRRPTCAGRRSRSPRETASSWSFGTVYSSATRHDRRPAVVGSVEMDTVVIPRWARCRAMGGGCKIAMLGECLGSWEERLRAEEKRALQPAHARSSWRAGKGRGTPEGLRGFVSSSTQRKPCRSGLACNAPAPRPSSIAPPAATLRFHNGVRRVQRRELTQGPVRASQALDEASFPRTRAKPFHATCRRARDRHTAWPPIAALPAHRQIDASLDAPYRTQAAAPELAPSQRPSCQTFARAARYFETTT